MTNIPLIIEPDFLEKHLDDENLLIIDLCKHSQYLQGHIPGAVFLEYSYITAMNKPTMGLLPDEETIGKIISALGITAKTHIVAYDDEGGGKASRFIWTLHALGHMKTSLLNGGLISWANENHPLDNKQQQTAPSTFSASYSNSSVVADADYIFRHLEADGVKLLDARSIQEYDGVKRFAERAGHIPGAIHFEWTDGLDRNSHFRFLDKDKLKSELNEQGLSSDKEIIVYCQTHHRSSLSYVMLKYLGYDRVRGYPGSWSEWGNLEDMPVEV
jgi:thiosulfate/3-mercaptopyruvate sulfurtransferase